MSKLVDKERLAKLAQALDSRMKAAVQAEKERAMGVEAEIGAKADQNVAAIAAINNENTGLLAQAKAYADGKDADLNNKINNKVDQSVYDAKVTELVNKDNEQAGLINGLDAAVKAIEGKMGDGDLNLPAIDKAITDFKAEQKEVDAAQDQKVAALEVALNGDGEDAAGLIAEVDAVEAKVQAIEQADFQKQIDDEEARAKAEEERIAGLVNGMEPRLQAVEEFVEDHDHAAIEEAIEALQELHKEGGVVDGKVSEVREAVEGLQSEVTEFKAAQQEKEAAQDEAIAAKVAQADYDEKVGDLEQADADLDAAIKAEAARAAGVEGGLQQAIDAINNADTGILKQAQEFAQGKVDAEKERAEGVEQGLDNRLKAIEASVGEGGTLEGRVAANEAKLAGLEEDTVQAAIDQAEADAKAHAEQKIAELVNSAPEAMNTLKELADEIAANESVYNAYVAEHATAMANQKADLQKEIDDDIAAARTLISAEIDADVKVEADRAKAEEQDIRADFAAADAALKGELQAEIDADVKVEKDRAEAAEKALGERIDGVVEQVGKDIAAAVLVEENRAKGEEQRIEAAYKAADEELAEKIEVLESLVGVGGEDQENVLDVMQGEIDALEGEVANLKAEDQRLAGLIANKVEQSAYETKVGALEDADEALDERIKVFEANGDLDVAALKARVTEAEGDIDDLEAFVAGHSHAQMEADIAQLKLDVAAVDKEIDDKIAQEVLDRNAAIEEALKDYADKEEVLAILGNVVNSLALTMEDNKMVLKLGGVEGVAINEVSLDMATDDDIAAIIDGLDA